jgi:predicted lipoprotein with Yx(FWY)xxD motif
LALDNAGTVELAVVNISGGNDLTETGLISTTAEGGAGAADSASTVYSTTARTNLAYRVVGYIESTQATAGTWATTPSTIQGCGGQALTAMSSLGYGQTWQTVTRTSGTTYYNTTGKPIYLFVTLTTNASASVTINGVVNNVGTATVGTSSSAGFVIPPGVSYLPGGTNFSGAAELR